MSDIRFTNFAYSLVAAGLDAEATTIAVEPGHGARFPVLENGNFFYVTLENPSLDREIVKVTARVDDTLTVVRGQDNTTARAWNAGDTVALRLNAAAIMHMFNEVVRRSSPAGAALIPTGTTDERPVVPYGGLLRYNSDLQEFEGYDKLGWGRIGGDATNAEIAAREAAEAAEAASAEATEAKEVAEAAAEAAQIAAASNNIPDDLTGAARQFLQVKEDETGYELVVSVATPTFFGFNLSADKTELVHTFGRDDYNVEEFATWALSDGVTYSIVNNNLVINL
jgi:hypothetical protein